MRGKDRDSSGLPYFAVHFPVASRPSRTELAPSDRHRRTEEVVVSEETTLRKLNAGYINSYLTGDVVWYDAHLDDDFICIQSDGSVLDKPRFLFQTARGPDVARYQLDQVRIRVIGTTALVHGTGLFTTPDGHEGTSRYTDVYAKLDGRWKVVAAQVTRAMNAHPQAGPPPLA
jgi:ketosteroid isomerase-like protein